VSVNPTPDPQYGRRGIKTDQTPRIPRAKIHNSAAQSLTSGTAVTPTLDVLDYDTHGSVSASSLICRVAGVYLIHWAFTLLTTNAISALSSVLVNGTQVTAVNDSRAANVIGGQNFETSIAYPLQRGDAITVNVRQDSAGAVNLQSGTAALSMTWLGNL
jgi:hypothetical protein